MQTKTQAPQQGDVAGPEPSGTMLQRSTRALPLGKDSKTGNCLKKCTWGRGNGEPQKKQGGGDGRAGV